MRACTWPLGITRHGTAVQVAEQVPLSKLNAYQRLSVKSVPLSINFRVTLIQTAADKECYAATTLCHRLIVYYVLGGSVSLIFDGMTTVNDSNTEHVSITESSKFSSTHWTNWSYYSR